MKTPPIEEPKKKKTFLIIYFLLFSYSNYIMTKTIIIISINKRCNLGSCIYKQNIVLWNDIIPYILRLLTLDILTLLPVRRSNA